MSDDPLADKLVGLGASPDLASLGRTLRAFNLFDMIGMAGQEIRHSRTLANLLDPSGPHGLGDAFLAAFLARILGDASAISLNLEGARVRTEWRSIDILITLPKQRLVVAVENKVWATEREGQLSDYETRVIAAPQFEGWDTGFAFLTPEGRAASTSAKAGWRPLSYDWIAQELGALSERDGLAAAPRLLLQHYVRMLRRHVLGDRENLDLARKILAEHRDAIEFISDNLLGVTKEFDILEDCVRAIPGLIPARHTQGLFRFVAEEWIEPGVEATGLIAWRRSPIIVEIMNKRDEFVLRIGSCREAMSHVIDGRTLFEEMQETFKRDLPTVESELVRAGGLDDLGDWPEVFVEVQGLSRNPPPEAEALRAWFDAVLQKAPYGFGALRETITGVLAGRCDRDQGA